MLPWCQSSSSSLELLQSLLTFQYKPKDRVRVLRAVPVSVDPPSLKVGTFNARSVANKVASVCDWIADNSLHVAALVETWHNGIDSPSIIACTPPGYRLVERARPRTETASSTATNHGGVCLFHAYRLHVQSVVLPDYDRSSTCVYAQGSGINTLIIVLYCPGSATVTGSFLNSFSDLLERTAAYKSVIILADVNIQLDIVDNPFKVKFNHLLSVFRLLQHVQQPTHSGGHLST